ncbi:MAG TPA: hypothetical protein VHG09_15350 [Longimicrobiales bacterium]|nr:hypothetical protein [Longimicrobiales bacterium]
MLSGKYKLDTVIPKHINAAPYQRRDQNQSGKEQYDDNREQRADPYRGSTAGPGVAQRAGSR